MKWFSSIWPARQAANKNLAKQRALPERMIDQLEYSLSTARGRLAAINADIATLQTRRAELERVISAFDKARVDLIAGDIVEPEPPHLTLSPAESKDAA